MTIVDTRPITHSVFEGRQRSVAAAFLVLGPAIMLASSIMASLAQSKAPGASDVEVAVAAPTQYFLGLAFDLLTPPTLLAWVVVLLLALRPWAARTAWTGAIALGLQACGLAAVTGMELCAATLAVNGMDTTRITSVMDSGITTSSAGKVLAIMFFPTEIVGLIAIGIAVWRTRWAPRAVAVVLIASPFIDFLVNGTPWASAGFFVLFFGASAWLAVLISRNGAPIPNSDGHTV